MKKVKIWCDGACAGNPGPGAYAYLLKYGEHEKIECFGHPETTTNQQMELMAAIGALGALKEQCEVTLITDSRYVVRGMAPYQENGKTYSAWLPKWKANGWRNSQKKPVENKDLWEMLDRTAGIHVVTWVHTAGHATCTENNRVDSLAFNKAQSLKKGG